MKLFDPKLGFSVFCILLSTMTFGWSESVYLTGTGWTIKVLSASSTSVFKGTKDAQAYDGTVSRTPVEQRANPRHHIVLLELEVVKTKAGSPNFSWKSLQLLGDSGPLAGRIADDRFVSDFGYRRMAGTDLSFGVSRGYICFEVADQAVARPLTLAYGGTPQPGAPTFQVKRAEQLP